MPISTSYYQQELQTIKDKVFLYTFHPMIQQYLQVTPFSSMRQHMGFLLLRDAAVGRDEALTAIISMSLVEMGMDIHDHVSLEDTVDSDELKVRQLKVLAGDYYSSQYYKLLADTEQSDLLGIYSEAICQINLYKMTEQIHLSAQTLSFENYKHLTIERRAALLDALVQTYATQDGPLWRSLYRALLWLEWVQQEFEKLQWNEDVTDGLCYLYLMEKSSLDEKVHLLQDGSDNKSKRKALIYKYRLQSWLCHEMERSITQVSDIVNKLPNALLEKEMQIAIYPYSSYLADQTKTAEEL
jgi:heptaprenyl diphosphate synthase